MRLLLHYLSIKQNNIPSTDFEQHCQKTNRKQSPNASINSLKRSPRSQNGPKQSRDEAIEWDHCNRTNIVTNNDGVVCSRRVLLAASAGKNAIRCCRLKAKSLICGNFRKTLM